MGSQAEALSRHPRRTAHSIGAENRDAPVCVSIVHPNRIDPQFLDRQGAVCTDTSATITQPRHVLGVVPEDLSPGTGPEDEVVAGRLDLEQMSVHCASPTTVEQVADSDRFPALSSARTA